MVAGLDSISAAPPNLPMERVASACREQFGLAGQFTPLVSERDQNFALQANDGRRFVVKVTSQVEDAAVTDFQIQALLHLEQVGVAGVPRIVRTMSGDDRGLIQGHDGTAMCLRVVTWLEGRMLHDVPLSVDIARAFGRHLADLDLGLLGFTHSGDRQILLWDTQRAAELRGLLLHIDDAAIRAQVEKVLNAFDERVIPQLQALPHQVIHNDANSENVLLDDTGEVTGMIDFGDMLWAPRIIEISTAASYLRTSDRDPLKFIMPFVAGYHERSPLSDAELNILFDLVRTRLAMTLSILYWRVSAREPGDSYREKALANEASAADFLASLSAIGRAEVSSCLRTGVSRK